MQLLLTSVFGPYAVDDEYGEKENKMELFHNQVTREQGIFSYRFNHGSQGLSFLAENIDMPTTVLDFPTLKRFKKELAKGYDFIGISFIVPNFKKAKEMARTVREASLQSKIILGGHGVNIPDIESMIDHDFICKGEGVYFLRKLFKESITKPIKHPLEYSSFNRRVMGVPWAPDASILIPGVGCANKCRFCATSHFFGNYIPYLKTGQEIFDVCCRYEDEKNTIWEDVDFATSLNPDYLQFMQLGPMPGTKLYTDYEESGKLVKNLPYESQHGQGRIWFHHDHFTRDESKDFLRLAFEIDYSRNGASMLRAIKTAFEGYLYCKNHTNKNIQMRAAIFKNKLGMMRYFITASRIFVQNRQSEILLADIKKLFSVHFGKKNILAFLKSMAVVLLSVREYLK